MTPLALVLALVLVPQAEGELPPPAPEEAPEQRSEQASEPADDAPVLDGETRAFAGEAIVGGLPLPPPPPGEGWESLDGVVFQAGDDVVTLTEVYAQLARERRRGAVTITTREDLDRALNDALEELVHRRLEAQAGEDRQERPEELDTAVERFLADRRREAGLVNHVEELETIGLSARREKEYVQSQTYRDTFLREGLLGPRPTRDRYVRPGELRWLYGARGEALGEPDQVQLRVLDVVSELVGGHEEALRLAQEVRARLEAGEDFALLHEEFGATYRESSGVTEFFALPDLGDPSIREWARDAAVGELSPVLPIRGGGELRGYRLLRLLERRAGRRAPPFASWTLQEELRDATNDEREEARLERARGRLRARAFLWPPPVRTGAPAPGEPGPGAGAPAGPPASTGAPEGR